MFIRGASGPRGRFPRSAPDESLQPDGDRDEGSRRRSSRPGSTPRHCSPPGRRPRTARPARPRSRPARCAPSHGRGAAGSSSAAAAPSAGSAGSGPSGRGGSSVTCSGRSRAAIRSPASGAARAPPRPPRSTITAIAILRMVDGSEPDEPRVRRAAAAELGRARTCPRSGCPGTFAPGRELPPDRALDRALHRLGDRGGVARSMTRAISVGPIAWVPPRPVVRDDEVRLHQDPAVRDSRRDQRHLERRDERLRLAVRGVRELDVVGEAARPEPPPSDLRARPSAGRTGSARRTPSGRRSRRGPRRRSASPASAYQMFDDHSVAAIEIERPARDAGVLADPEAVDDEPALLGLRLLREGRRRRWIGSGAETGDRGHDLEHRARDVQALGRPVQERLGRCRPGGRRTPSPPSPGSRPRRCRRSASTPWRGPRRSAGRASPRRPDRSRARRPPPAGASTRGSGSASAGRTGRARTCEGRRRSGRRSRRRSARRCSERSRPAVPNCREA